MRGWVDIASLIKPKNINGGLVARGAAGLPFVLCEGLRLAVVPPQTDVPRMLTIRELQEKDDREVLLYFHEVDDLSTAEGLVGCHLLALEDEVDLTALEDEAILPLWEGWELRDANVGVVGTIASLNERASQPLITLACADGREVLVPLAEELVKEVNEEARTITMTLPRGLLDM